MSTRQPVVVALAAFWLAAHCYAGKWDRIPSDAASVSAHESQRFLEMICPGHTSTTGCSVCPAEMPASAQTWELRTITFGHFAAANSEDALVSGSGCEPHSNGMSGAYLFTKDGAQWRKIWYGPGENAFDCKKLAAADGREVLICEGADMHQGVADSFLYLLDAGQDPGKRRDNSLDIFFGLDDSLGSCVKLPDGTVIRGEIGTVSFVPALSQHGVRIVVTARLGKAVVPDHVMQKCQFGLKGPVRITTVPRRYEFFFDGQKVVPNEKNPATEHAWATAPLTSYQVTH